MSRSTSVTRRSFLKTSASGVAAASVLGKAGSAYAAEPVYFATWSAAVDTVKSHIAAFEAKTGLKVEYSNSPWAQFRETMVTKFIGKAPIDTLWVSDSWLPEWADAGWIVPIDQYKTLTGYNADVDQFCVDSMSYKGKQYGITYYTDFMGFIYNAELLDKAGIKAPPVTWAEVTEQAKIIKDKGLSQWPVLLALAQETWLIEFLAAMIYSQGGRFTDDKGESIMQDPATARSPRCAGWSTRVQKHKIMSPSCVETGELAGAQELLGGPARLRADAEVPPAHAQRSQAEPDLRQDQDRPDAQGRERLARDRRLDALLRHDAAAHRPTPRAPPTP